MDSSPQPRQESPRPRQVATNGNDRSAARGTINCKIYGFLNLDGAESRTRTDDLLITNQLLYQLSYFGFPHQIVPLRSDSVKFRAETVTARSMLRTFQPGSDRGGRMQLNLNRGRMEQRVVNQAMVNCLVHAGPVRLAERQRDFDLDDEVVQARRRPGFARRHTDLDAVARDRKSV